MEEEVAVPDLVEDDDAVVTARVTTVESLTVVVEANFEEGAV